jgi:hypothetical protein
MGRSEAGDVYESEVPLLLRGLSVRAGAHGRGARDYSSPINTRQTVCSPQIFILKDSWRIQGSLWPWVIALVVCQYRCLFHTSVMAVGKQEISRIRTLILVRSRSKLLYLASYTMYGTT